MPRSREVSSRYLSPASTASLHDGGFSSPHQCFSPLHRKSAAARTDPRKPRNSLDHNSPGELPKGLIWPSATSSKKVDTTLADHLGNERYKDQFQRRDHLVNSDAAYRKTSNCKENQQPKMGGSMRYTGKLNFLRKSNSRNSASSSLSSEPFHLTPGRLSVDENALNGRRRLDSYADSIQSELFVYSDVNSGSMEFESSSIGKTSSLSSHMSLTSSSQKHGREVSSKYMHDSKSRPNRGAKDSSHFNPISSDDSPKLRRFTIKNEIRRADLVTSYGSSTSQWALSPGRSSSPPGLIEKKGKSFSFSSLKPPTSPSKSKTVEKFLNMGLDLFKSKKSSSPSSFSSASGNVEIAHRIRLLHNGLMQWRYANARSNVVNESMTRKAEGNLICAWDSLQTLRLSVVQKRLHLQKEKLGMKLNYILHFQMRPLQSWGEMERQYVSALSQTIDSLHSVVCRVPLIDGAKLDTHSASIAIRHTLDLTASIKSMLSTLSPSVEGTSFLLAELAEVVAQEKSVLAECIELCKIISVLEIQERSLKGQIVQLRSEIAREAPVVAGQQDKNNTLLTNIFHLQHHSGSAMRTCLDATNSQGLP